MKIDSHQHFWTLSRGDYPWPNESVAPIFRDFGPQDLRSQLDAAGIDKTIVVQATDSVAETEFLFELAEETPWIAGIVGWVDLAAPDAIATMDRLRRNPILKGLRPMLQNIEDTTWILRDEVQPALAHMAEVGLRFDALVQPRHLPAMLKLAQRYPTLPIVIDHIAKPQMGPGQMPDDAWLTGMARLAALENVCCKLSGLITQAEDGWQPADIAPFAAHVLEAFGPKKTLFGSDWPVVNLAGSYAGWAKMAEELISAFSPDEQADIMGGAACRFYGI